MTNRIHGRVPNIVSAREFRLVDDNGDTRASLCMENGQPMLAFMHPRSENALVKVGITESGCAAIIVNQPNGESSIFLHANKDGASRVVLSDTHGAIRLVIGVTDQNDPHISMKDEKGAVCAEVTMDGSECSRLTFSDSMGQRRVYVGLGEEDACGMWIVDGTDSVRAKFGMFDDIGATFEIKDASGEIKWCQPDERS